jgi:DNA polymerase IIIc chi subunit
LLWVCIAAVKDLVYEEQEVLVDCCIYIPQLVREFLEEGWSEDLHQRVCQDESHLQLLGKELWSFLLAIN